MLKLEFTVEALKYLQSIEWKHAGQIALRVLQLLASPDASDVKLLRGEMRLHRATAGEYRIVFYVEADLLRVVLIYGDITEFCRLPYISWRTSR